MTFVTTVLAVDGNAMPSQVMRMALQASTQGSQGVIGALDCIVNQTTVASSGIVVTAGNVLVAGAEALNQGTYSAYNPGNDTTLSIAATGGSPRSDMVIIRAEDPTWSGSGWGNPASGQILFPRILSGVAGGATTVSGGYSAIPLARIDMPASTTNVLQSYIHDLRAVANPQGGMITTLITGGPGTASNWTVTTTQTAWPAIATWQVAVPTWATFMQAHWTVTDLLYTPAGTNWARGFVGPVFGSSVTAPNLAWPQALVSVTGTTAFEHSISGAAALAIGPALRGTTQTLQFAEKTDGTQTGLCTVNEGTQISIVYEFQQLAALT
jgi:hypothetical protein